ncbi:hypothetical protein FB595_1464 [Sphingobium sp. AEW010]|nr:hypothetical protein [Sphingobium sp. JAI105]PSO09597.1 hypothetical protein C7E20_21750 [Sphingobium sp. AEW4]TWC96604.1 hypothetical protein FB595_1464 [Sphingobium sp. AEW010]TWD16431.1 hypothetical protein FB596_1474 [Sphingobium sp. AEW013]TWD19755.1 hypothetical protein FB594_1474 [Sphingobium sp. AEW001]
MTYRSILSVLALSIISSAAYPAPQVGKVTTIDLGKATLDRKNVEVSSVRYRGANALLLTTAPDVADDATFAAIRGATASDFVIEAVLSGAPVDDTTTARGFVGIAFRISENRDRFEAIYLRPTNAHADDQLRRNHTVQYISHPAHPWERLRKEAPGQYESYADVKPAEWIKLKIVVRGSAARLYVNGQQEPSLIVNDLKLPPASGGIGLWVGPGSLGHFKSLKISVERP